MREVVNAILHQSRSGCQWDLLPHDLPPAWVVKYYFLQVVRRRQRDLETFVTTGEAQ
ncbi:transposase [Streptomyces huasconensis]|uniref:transposase n=1 Tax=Streptomyces TaxID=1883 RepID=UPI0038B42657